MPGKVASRGKGGQARRHRRPGARDRGRHAVHREREWHPDARNRVAGDGLLGPIQQPVGRHEVRPIHQGRADDEQLAYVVEQGSQGRRQLARAVPIWPKEQDGGQHEDRQAADGQTIKDGGGDRLGG